MGWRYGWRYASNAIVLTVLMRWLAPEVSDHFEALTTILAVLGAVGGAVGSAAGAAGGAIGGLAGGLGSALGIGGGAGAAGAGAAGAAGAGAVGAGAGGALTGAITPGLASAIGTGVTGATGGGGGLGALGGLGAGAAGLGGAGGGSLSSGGLLGTLGGFLKQTPIGTAYSGISSGNYGQVASGLSRMLGGSRGGSFRPSVSTSTQASPQVPARPYSYEPSYTPWQGVDTTRPDPALRGAGLPQETMGDLMEPQSSDDEGPGFFQRLILGPRAADLTPEERKSGIYSSLLQGASSALRYVAANPYGETPRQIYTGPNALSAGRAYTDENLERRSESLRNELALANLQYKLGAPERKLNEIGYRESLIRSRPPKPVAPRTLETAGPQGYGDYLLNPDGTLGNFLGGGKPTQPSQGRQPGVQEQMLAIEAKPEAERTEEEKRKLAAYYRMRKAGAPNLHVIGRGPAEDDF